MTPNQTIFIDCLCWNIKNSFENLADNSTGHDDETNKKAAGIFLTYIISARYKKVKIKKINEWQRNSNN